MPLKLEIDALSTELSQINKLLADAQKYGDPLGQIQYEERRNELESQLNDMSRVDSKAASIAVFFGGKPVYGSYGMAADFAGKSLQNFQKIVTTSFATANLGSLGTRGRLPQGESASLLITNVSRGSFGFILEEALEQPELFDTKLKAAVDFSVEAIVKSSMGSEDDFDELTEELDGRTLIALSEFFGELDRKEATIRLVDNNYEYAIDEQAVKRGRERTEHTSMEEDTIQLDGQLVGMVPSLKKFQILLTSNESISGGADDEAVEVYENWIQEGKPIVGKPTKAEFIKRIVQKRNHSPKTVYRLLKFITIDNFPVTPTADDAS